ncbi:radical SAM protein [Denitratisoma oestradiolicum]|uniref:Fe-S oxidoreductase n=1 Tax=Denitratisoma oestradiolicum TaxID=311182 RepID=A0A6S6XV16_9PROT|nr:radical SAM protein [Denitratisoma oestradiolicum]TWO81443.1 radical SAM protein [Denitratisoma oestradiolicum]CAB1368645.1 Fe-S oxidoreductase [Denitratisoma oestradiolicum]
MNPARSLTATDHSRDSAGLTYVYPVISRRAGGVSIGINLNPNNACNWRCIYCQVPDLVRGGPPAIDLELLKAELDGFLDDIVHGDFMEKRVPEGARRLMDLAFSGNGEPTSAAEFPAAVELAAGALERHGLKGRCELRLISNGSLMDRKAVQQGVARLGAHGGEVWFKVDGVTAAALARINSTRTTLEALVRRLGISAGLCRTWVQTCVFTLDGEPPAAREVDAYVETLAGFAGRIAGVLLYPLARPSLQAEAGRLGQPSAAWVQALETRLREAGLVVRVSF